MKTSKGIIKELSKVINAVGTVCSEPNDIAIVTEVDNEICYINHKDLHKYEYKNGEIKLKKI